MAKLVERYFAALTANDDATVGALKNAEAVDLMHKMRAAFPDAHWTHTALVESGDTVTCGVTFVGTQTGALGSHPATGRKVNVHVEGLTMTVAGDKITASNMTEVFRPAVIKAIS